MSTYAAVQTVRVIGITTVKRTSVTRTVLKPTKGMPSTKWVPLHPFQSFFSGTTSHFQVSQRLGFLGVIAMHALWERTKTQ
jgi:hypothetical protein